MKVAQLLIFLTLSATILASVVPHLDRTPNPNDIFKQVQFNGLNVLNYAQPTIHIDLDLLTIGYHGDAYQKIKVLYPDYSRYPVIGCSYIALGYTRFYSFDFKVSEETKTATTAIETEAQTSDSDSHDHDDDKKDGFAEVNVAQAHSDSRISAALNNVIKSNWNDIGANPLISCWTKPFGGVRFYRFYFNRVPRKFEYNEAQDDHSVVLKTSPNYYVDVESVFSVGHKGKLSYTSLSLEELKANPAWPSISAELQKQLGHFNDSWVVDFQVTIVNNTNHFKFAIHFQPFLLKQHYEAYYYGSVQKAALLKIDEVVFNTNGKSYEDWQNIEKFDSYRAFHDSHNYVLSQFTWLRHYKVTSAYSALHLKGRYVRLVYQGKAAENIDAGNQINIVVFIDECNKYWIDRNDFLATNLQSAGRNNWVSLFVPTPDVTKAEYYQQIVQFFKSIYPKFWGANQLVDIKLKDNLHVVQFQNPTNLCNIILNVNKDHTELLNKVGWVPLSNNSPLGGRLENYVRAKSNADKIMFVQYFQEDNGTHFEVSYIDHDKKYGAAYVLYIPATDVFCDDNNYHFKGVSYSNEPLPSDLKGSLESFLKADDDSLIAIVGYVSLSQNSFAVIGISNTGRWQITVVWINGKWAINSKQPYSEGYYRAHGYPSSSVASCTGFLQKLYPTYFVKGFLYTSIETKTVGVNIYYRLVYDFVGIFYQAIIQTTFGVDNSHVLSEWKAIDAIRVSSDYGHGFLYDYSYDVDSKYLYRDQKSTKPNLSVEYPTLAFIVQACPERTRREIFTGQCIPYF